MGFHTELDRTMESMDASHAPTRLARSHSISQSDHSGSAPLKDNTTMWMDLLDNCGMELFGCDENCTASAGRKVLGESFLLRQAAEQRALHNWDYAAQHDEFLESLLHEQTLLTASGSGSNEEDDSCLSSIGPSGSSSVSIASSTVTTQTEETIDSTRSARKRRRPLRLSRRSSPTRIRNSKAVSLGNRSIGRASNCSSLEQQRTLRLSSESTVTVSLAELSRAEFPDPSTYLHPHCRMQKDKGKGEPIGSNICAKGPEACMEKLRTKMHLLTDVAFKDKESGSMKNKKGPATMKRRKARVAEHLENFCETRSLIELRMGFLSMQYGVLLRWDTGRTGKITLVVLRKMCHESFYPNKTKQSKHMNANALPTILPSDRSGNDLVWDVVGDKHAILPRSEGMEVSLLEPPYRVPRPEVFDPTVLSVKVSFAVGLSRRSNWTIQLIYGDTTENVLLSWDHRISQMVPKLGDPLKHVVPKLLDFDLSTLEVKLFEHRVRRRFQRRLIACMKVPLGDLAPQPVVGGEITQMKVACEHNSNALIALDVCLLSDYAHWLKKELDARRKEESSGYAWRSPFRLVNLDGQQHVFHEEKEEEEPNENLDPWEWICSVC